jgi:hypothetical protein
MGFLLQAIYTGVFKYFCIPIFILMLVGRPRFLINWIHKLINIREPFKKIKVFRGAFLLCLITVVWSYFRKWSLEKLVQEIANSETKQANTSFHFLDEKLREAHLFERNAYMFFTFMILMVIVEKFCHSYFKLWNLQDELKRAKVKDSNKEIVKDPKLKKNE